MNEKSNAVQSVGRQATIDIETLAGLLAKSQVACRLDVSGQTVDYYAGVKKTLKFISTANGRLFFPEDVERLRIEIEARRARRARKVEAATYQTCR